MTGLLNDKYILVNHGPVVENDLFKWGRWMQVADRHVARDMINDIRVSTIFLGLDYSFGGSAPLLFETMVFGGVLDQEQDRCSTWAQAEAMHASMCKRVVEEQP